MLPWSAELAGTLTEHVIDSELLRDNPLGDPHRRPLWVYAPPGYADDHARRYPAVYVIQGFTGHLAMWHNRSPFRQPFTETADQVFASGQAPLTIVVFVDAWTSYGGSQFVDSPGTGRYHSYLCQEVLPWVDDHYRTQAGPEHRAIMGKSSGGFGAMITPMLRPDLFGALASHAGVGSRVAFTKAADHELLGILGVAAAFSANEDGTIELPFDPRTGVIRAEVWQRWLNWDPVRMAPRYAEALRSLRAIWIDAGTGDEYFLDVGAAALRAKLLVAGVRDEVIRFELFDATHAAIEYRYPLSLAWLCANISG